MRRMSWTLLPVLSLACLSAASAAGPAVRPTAEGMLAEEILRQTGVKAGVCVHLGVTDGRLTAALARSGAFLVHGLATDAAAVEQARTHIRSLGTYGMVSVERSSYARLPYAENLVNVLVVEDLPALVAQGLSLDEVVRVLAPRGVVCFGGTVEPADLTARGLTHVRTSSDWTLAVKPVPKEMDDWPCFDYGPAGNAVSRDLLAAPGTSLRWRIPVWSRHCVGVVTGWVSAGGRMFYCLRKLLPDGYRVRYVLTGRDAYNGQLLWERPVTWPIGSKYGDRNVVATADRLYLPLEPRGPVVALDTATGKVVRTYAGTGRPEQMILHEGKLIVSVWNRAQAVDVKTGKVLWTSKGKGGPMVLAEGNLYLFAYPRELRCLHPATGEVRWMSSFGPAAINRYNSPFYYRGTLVLVKANAGKTHKYGLKVDGYSTKDGRRLWRYEPRSILRRGGCFMGEVFGAQEMVWVHAAVNPDPARNNAGDRPSAWVGLDPASGLVRKRFDDATSDPDVMRMLANGTHRCNRGRATERGYLFGTNEFFEWRTGAYRGSNVTRSHCGIGTGMLPANGLLYAPPPTCVCRTFIERGGFHALAHRPDGIRDDDRNRLERGSGAPPEPSAAAAPSDWPCYRYNAARHGATDSAVPSDLKPLWSAGVGRGLTAPTLAGGTVFVAASDEHRVTALDATSGEPLWSYTAGGRVDSPPTVARGLVVFGCRDGRVYCVRAGDGTLVWRFRAAPIEERILVNGQFESAWPVHGSVLLLKGVVYGAAGWHTALDGGVTLFALRADNGEMVWRRHLEKLPGDFRTADGPVALLSSDGTHIHMGRRMFDAKTGEPAAPRGRSRVMDFGLSGFRDNDWSQFSNTKGRSRWSDGRARGELLASGTERTCGVSVQFRGRDDGACTGRGHYRLFGHVGREKQGWSIQVPLAMRALVLAGGTLFVAGRPDPEIEELKALKDWRRTVAIAEQLPEERLIPRGGELWAFSAADGRRLSALKLDAPPVFDGMAAAGERLYLSTLDGRLHCFGRK